MSMYMARPFRGSSWSELLYLAFSKSLLLGKRICVPSLPYLLTTLGRASIAIALEVTDMGPNGLIALSKSNHTLPSAFLLLTVQQHCSACCRISSVWNSEGVHNCNIAFDPGNSHLAVGSHRVLGMLEKAETYQSSKRGCKGVNVTHAACVTSYPARILRISFSFSDTRNPDTHKYPDFVWHNTGPRTTVQTLLVLTCTYQGLASMLDALVSIACIMY